MKILCLIEALGSGGAERQLTGLAAMLKLDGYGVKVITYYPKDFYKYVLDDAGVDYEYLSKAQSKLRRIPEIVKAIKAYKPDAVIAYSPSVSEIACGLKAIGFSFKLIVSERNTSQINNRSEKTKFFCYRWADYVVPNSQMQANFISTYYPELNKKIRVITNFVDTDYFSPVDCKIYDSEICRIICVGRDNPQKNQFRFIDVIKILSAKGIGIHVDWYGRFESSYGQACKEKVTALGLDDFITFYGETKNVRDEYRKHDVFCLPSIYEGFPNVLCEAMSCGLPVLCSNVCDNPTIVTDGKNGILFNPENIVEMAEKIEHFVKMDTAKKREMGDEARNKAEKMFSKVEFLRKYKELL